MSTLPGRTPAGPDRCDPIRSCAWTDAEPTTLSATPPLDGSTDDSRSTIGDFWAHLGNTPTTELRIDALHRSRRSREGGGRGVPSAPGRRDHAELPRARHPARRPDPGRDRGRPHPLRRRPRPEGIRRLLAHHQGLRQEIVHHPPLGENDRLNHAGYLWAFAALRHSPGANAPYRRRREIGDWHAAAQRNLFNRMIGQLYHCLQHGETYDEARAFPVATSAPEVSAPNRISRPLG